MSSQKNPRKDEISPEERSSIASQVQSSVLEITAALNNRDFTAETWDALLSPKFAVESDILPTHGAQRELTLTERRSFLQQLCQRCPELECVILDMDTTVDETGLHAVVMANRETKGVPAGVTKQAVVFWHFARNSEGQWLCVREKMIHGMIYDGYARR